MRKIFAHLFFLLVLVSASPAYAVGVAAGTSITNTVTVNFTIGGTAGVALSTDVFQVQEVINVDVSWQDAANITVAPASTQQVQTYRITNTGNGVESFSLQLNNSPTVSDQFDPVNGNIYLDSNNNGLFDGIGTDALYVPGTNDPVLDANNIDSQIIFLVSDIPAGLAINDLGASELTANALTPGAAGAVAGTNLNGLGDGGVDAVVGGTQATDVDNGFYQIDTTPIDVNILKSAQVVSDGAGCTSAPCTPVTGATIRYTLQVNVTGVGTINNLVITDPIPTDTTYVNESIDLNSASLTDSGVDADAGNFSANTVTVNLGNITGAVTHFINFDVTIN